MRAVWRTTTRRGDDDRFDDHGGDRRGDDDRSGHRGGDDDRVDDDSSGHGSGGDDDGGGTTTTAAATAAAATVDPTRMKATERGRPTAAPAVPTLSVMAGGRPTILMVEDEESITEPLVEALDREGFETSVAGTVAGALEQARREPPDLVLLDVMLPDGSGYDVCRELRRDSDVPIIMLTARGEETDRVVGLELGADDYVVKPFSAREVVARIRAVLRRSGGRDEEDAPAGPLEVAELRLDPEPAQRDARRHGARAHPPRVRAARAADARVGLGGHA